MLLVLCKTQNVFSQLVVNATQKKTLNLIKKCLSVISREFFSHDISRIVLVELLESAGLLSQTWPWKSVYSCLNRYHISESARTWTPVTACGFRGWIFFMLERNHAHTVNYDSVYERKFAHFQWISLLIEIREMVSFQLGKEIEKDDSLCGVSVAQWLEHQSAESEGLRFELNRLCIYGRRQETGEPWKLSNKNEREW